MYMHYGSSEGELFIRWVSPVLYLFSLLLFIGGDHIKMYSGAEDWTTEWIHNINNWISKKTFRRQNIFFIQLTVHIDVHRDAPKISISIENTYAFSYS